MKGERERLLARAFMIRVIVLMTLMPQARIGDVIAALAGDLALVPWARPWRPASARAAGYGGTRSARSPWKNCGTSCWVRPGASTGSVLPRRGDDREGEAAEGGVAGRDAAAGAGHAREQGVLRHRGHRR